MAAVLIIRGSCSRLSMFSASSDVFLAFKSVINWRQSRPYLASRDPRIVLCPYCLDEFGGVYAENFDSDAIANKLMFNSPRLNIQATRDG